MKVVIIGASTPGLFTANLLAKGGVEVEVYERMHSLGWPPGTIIVTSKLNEILGFIPEEAIVNNGMATTATDMATARRRAANRSGRKRRKKRKDETNSQH